MKHDVDTGDRRLFLRMTTSAAAAAVVGCATTGKRGREKTNSDEGEVTPGEDLMQEHGVLERILLIYDEVATRIEHGSPADMSVVTSAAEIVRRFVEDYHEKLEEQFVFPRLQTAGRETQLVATLLTQHARGRALTDDITRRAGAGTSSELATLLRSFVRMYRPHAAREETVLIPAFRTVVGRKAYRELGEQFEDKEHQLFGDDGFAIAVAEVTRLETALGIADLAAFTP